MALPLPYCEGEARGGGVSLPVRVGYGGSWPVAMYE